MKNKILRKVIEFVPILFVIGLAVALVYCIFYIGKLEDQIYERDKTIQELSFRSDLVEEYFDIKHDSVEHTTSYSLKRSVVNPVILQQDSTELLFHKGDKLLTAKAFVNEYNALSKDYNVLVNDYNKVIGDYNDYYNEKEFQIRELKSALGLIEKRYSIHYVVRRDSTFSVIDLSNTEKIDSALMLLPYYRDKLKKVSDEVWTIEYVGNKNNK